MVLLVSTTIAPYIRIRCGSGVIGYCGGCTVGFKQTLVPLFKVKVRTEGWVTVNEAVAVQELPSVAVTVYVPAASARAVLGSYTTTPVISVSTCATGCSNIYGCIAAAVTRYIGYNAGNADGNRLGYCLCTEAVQEFASVTVTE